MTETAGAYRVLARKYRPASFAELIGQDVLVRTLTNAIQSGRLAHAFVLTGVRGVGKTTTARIIAKALNYVGPDGQGEPRTGPFDDCPVCQAIAEDRHPDILEMDAASNTGVDDVREIIESVRYGPVSARYKVYIIDEVHMLSRNAFNALLKTLEEPPPHTKFIFATTEIRKVPVTVLSRCQRFDLRRVDQATLTAHFAAIAEKEDVQVEADALAMIARAADGSVRDGLSLLDQAIALATPGDTVTVTTAQVGDMLGLADRTVVIDLFDATVHGDAKRALGLLADLHAAGADPLTVVQDLLELTHEITRQHTVPELSGSSSIPEAERTRGADLARSLSMPLLTRAWQGLLKGLGEVQSAPVPQAALEMVVLRLIHAAGLPTPGEVIRSLQDGGAKTDPPARPAERGPSPVDGPPAMAAAPRPVGTVAAAHREAPRQEMAPQEVPPQETQALAPPQAAMPEDFPALVRLFEERADPNLAARLQTDVHLIGYEPGRIEFRPAASAPADLASKMMACLKDWTGTRWMVTVAREGGAPTLMEQAEVERRGELAEAAQHDVVRAVLDTFPGAKLTKIIDVSATAPSVTEDSDPTDTDPTEGEGLSEDEEP